MVAPVHMAYLLALALVMPAAAGPPAVGESVSARFAPPPGALRIPAPSASFGAYLRALPLLPEGSAVHTFDGKLKARQDAHAAVIDLSVGTKDLQQCADAVMRLRAEYLFAQGRHAELSFKFTNGDDVPFRRWMQGDRIQVTGNRTSWQRTATPDSSHAALLSYLEKVFMYAGTLSLSKELKAAGDLPLSIGDVFIQGGSPGHAVIVVDAAVLPDGRKAFLLAQSYMPAQQVHVLKNPMRPDLGAWYVEGDGEMLLTPEWTFRWSDRKRWP